VARVVGLAAAVALAACGETLSVQELVGYVKTRAQSDKDGKLAARLARVKLAEPLRDRTIEDLRAHVPGGATLKALYRLRDQTEGVGPIRYPRVAPSPEGRAAIIDDIRENALGYTMLLPDFICTQVMNRKVARAPAPKAKLVWQPRDRISLQLTYFNRQESYRVVEWNGLPSNADYLSMGGHRTYGTLGSALRIIFEPVSGAEFEWKGWEAVRERPVMVLRYRVPRESSRYRLTGDAPQASIMAAFHGEVKIVPATRVVLQFTMEAEGLPGDFQIKRASTMVDYAYDDVGGLTYLLPLKARSEMSLGPVMYRTDEDFRGYRKYAVESDLRFEGR
jgi:hypothetical protein